MYQTSDVSKTCHTPLVSRSNAKRPEPDALTKKFADLVGPRAAGLMFFVIDRIESCGVYLRKATPFVVVLGNIMILLTFVETSLMTLSSFHGEVDFVSGIWGGKSWYTLSIDIEKLEDIIQNGDLKDKEKVIAENDWKGDISTFGYFVGYTVVIGCGVCQLVGVGLVVFRKAIGADLLIVCLMTYCISHMFDLSNFLRCVSVCGGLCLVKERISPVEVTEKVGAEPMSGAIPSTRVLIGRLQMMVGRMVLPLTLGDFVYEMYTYGNQSNYMVSFLIVFILAMLVIMGLKAKPASLMLCLWLFVNNCYHNPFWSLTEEMRQQFPSAAEYMRFLFFEHLSVAGGLLLVSVHGPGRFSLDERKKFK